MHPRLDLPRDPTELLAGKVFDRVAVDRDLCSLLAGDGGLPDADRERVLAQPVARECLGYAFVVSRDADPGHAASELAWLHVAMDRGDADALAFQNGLACVARAFGLSAAMNQAVGDTAGATSSTTVDDVLERVPAALSTLIDRKTVEGVDRLRHVWSTREAARAAGRLTSAHNAALRGARTRLAARNPLVARAAEASLRQSAPLGLAADALRSTLSLMLRILAILSRVLARGARATMRAAREAER